MDIAQRIKSMLPSKGVKNFSELERICEISNGTIGKWGKGRYEPTMRNLEKISAFLNVPAEFLLGNGSFKNWDLILEHRNSILELISNNMSFISSNLKHGVDDTTFVKLVSLFEIRCDIDEHGNPDFVVFSPFDVSDIDTQISNIPYDSEIEVEFNKLDSIGRRVVWGVLIDEQRRMAKEENK